VVDGGASPHSAAGRHAQQPRLPSGADAPAAHGEPSPARHHDQAHIGTTIDNPNVDFAKIAQGLGRARAGTDHEPERSGAGACGAPIEVVKRGEPSLIDVVTQPR
jgi:hypothetical protein